MHLLQNQYGKVWDSPKQRIPSLSGSLWSQVSVGPSGPNNGPIMANWVRRVLMDDKGYPE